MQQVLQEKLHAYILINHPELAIELQASLSATAYLEAKVSAAMPLVLLLIGEQKPAYVIEELALREMTSELGPSRFNYIKEVLQTEFPDDFQRLESAGLITYEVLNMMEQCRETLDHFPFNEQTEDSRFLRYAIIAEIHAHLN